MFVPLTKTEWSKFDSDIKKNYPHAMLFKKLLFFIYLENTYGINDPFVVGLFSRLRLVFTHLKEHRFRHNFVGILIPLFPCSLETEVTEPYFLC